MTVRAAVERARTSGISAWLSDEFEKLGRVVPDRDVKWALQELTDALSHASPTCREGAVYGLAHIAKRFATATDDVLTRLRVVASDDPSPGVREAAEEVIEDVEDLR